MSNKSDEMKSESAAVSADDSCDTPKDNISSGLDDAAKNSVGTDAVDITKDKIGANPDDAAKAEAGKNGSENATPNEARRIRYPDDPPEDEFSRVKEAEVAYGHRKQQGEFTLEDYYALPDDVRAELIDGVIYDMSAPAASHQSIVAGLTASFYSYIRSKKGDCKVFPGPIDVQLDRDDRTMVQPDVLILCDRNKLRNGVVFGAPDLVVEVLSPSTGKKDRTVKLRKYRLAGVREYWIIDMQRKEVEVYLFQNPELDTLPKVYRFDSVIPVGIFGGDCKVDFAEISRDIWDM